MSLLFLVLLFALGHSLRVPNLQSFSAFSRRARPGICTRRLQAVGRVGLRLSPLALFEERRKKSFKKKLDTLIVRQEEVNARMVELEKNHLVLEARLVQLEKNTLTLVANSAIIDQELAKLRVQMKMLNDKGKFIDMVIRQMLLERDEALEAADSLLPNLASMARFSLPMSYFYIDVGEEKNTCTIILQYRLEVNEEDGVEMPV